MLIEFIADMDVYEVYKFVNLFPFLIDKESLDKIVEVENQ
jgi:hypothetical protein